MIACPLNVTAESREILPANCNAALLRNRPSRERHVTFFETDAFSHHVAPNAILFKCLQVSLSACDCVRSGAQCITSVWGVGTSSLFVRQRQRRPTRR